MPCHKLPNGKYRLGQKGNVYKDKKTWERVYRAYLANKHHSAADGKFLDDRKLKFKAFKKWGNLNY